MMRAVRVTVTLLALAVSVVAWPVALWAAVGNPWPAEGIDLGAPLTDQAIVFVLALLLWLLWVLWVQFVGCVFVEAIAAMRGTRARRVPGSFGIQQQLARRLVGALVAASIGVGAAATSVTAATQASPTAASTTDEPVAATSKTDTNRPDAKQMADGLPVHTVKRDDTLWDIAEEHLGDPMRYRDIVQLNRGRTMPDGRVFADGDKLRPGWQLRLPADADLQLASATSPVDTDGTRGDPVRVERGDTLTALAAKHLGDPNRWREILHANKGVRQADGGRLTDPGMLRPGWILHIPARGGSHAVSQNQGTHTTDSGDREHRIEAMHKEGTASTDISPPRTAEQKPVQQSPERRDQAPEAVPDQIAADDDGTDAKSDVAGDDDAVSPVWVAGGVAGVLAAGLVGLLARHRLLQSRRRRFGERIAMPEPGPAAIEEELRHGEDPLTVQAVDMAFRLLADRCRTAGLELPRIRTARLTDDDVEVYLVEAAAMPAPFEPTSSDGLWMVSREALDLDDAEAAELRTRVPAPYPTLVTFGVDVEGGHLLVNLEELGAVGVTGDAAVGREVLSAMALELAMCGWADELLITVVGMDEHLVNLDTGRIVHRPWESAVGMSEARARHARDELTEAGQTSAAQARLDEWEDGADWTPEIIVVAGELDHAQWERLAAVVEEVPRVAIAAVAQSATQAQWLIEVAADGDDVKAVLQPIGVQVVPQRVTGEVYAELVELVETTRRPSQPPETVVVGGVDVAHAPTAEDPAAATADVTYLPTTNDDRARITAGEPEEAPTGEDIDTGAASAVDEENPSDLEASDDGTAAEATASDDVTALRPPCVLVLGPLDVANARGPLPVERRNKALEIVAYLALRPGLGVEAFADAVWPDRNPTKDRSSAWRNRMAEVRKWLDTDPDGQPYLPAFRRGAAYELHPAVRTDWDDWRDLIGDDIAAVSTDALQSALQLVRGRPFEGVKTRTCAWAQPLITEILQQISDVADELGRRRLAAGRWSEAEQAAAVGLLCEPVAERLYRIQISAAYAAGDLEHAREAIDRMLNLFDQLEVEADEEETALLIEQIKAGAPREQVLAEVGIS